MSLWAEVLLFAQNETYHLERKDDTILEEDAQFDHAS